MFLCKLQWNVVPGAAEERRSHKRKDFLPDKVESKASDEEVEVYGMELVRMLKISLGEMLISVACTQRLSAAISPLPMVRIAESYDEVG